MTPTTSESSAPSSLACCGSSPSQSCTCVQAAPTTDGTAPNTEVLALTVHPDSRGNVRETYRASWLKGVPPVKQLVRSESVPKTLRGMHLHKTQFDIWHFAYGNALVRLYDHASGEQSFHDADAGTTLVIPPGISHGFYTAEGCVLMYALTQEYDGSDEYGWYPLDGLPDLDYQSPSGRWPRSHLGSVVSERDLRAPRLSDFVP